MRRAEGACTLRLRCLVGPFWQRAYEYITNALAHAGLINNVLYVVILTAALDLVGPRVPKGVVLLADVLPSFIVKLVAPYFIGSVPYSIRVLGFAAISTAGMLLIAHDASALGLGAGAGPGPLAAKMVGIVLASISSGGGELSFLSLTHYYGPLSLAAWGLGTGGAGLVGAGAYAMVTTVLGWSVRTALLASSGLPVVMVLAYFVVLPRGAMLRRQQHHHHHHRARTGGDGSDDSAAFDSEHGREHDGLLAPSSSSSSSQVSPPISWLAALTTNLKRSRRLFFPYMLPLLLVYLAEYTINQGVAPTLLFPLDQTPFQHYRAFYPVYNALYQVGVFISRGSTPFVRFHNLYLLSSLQVANLALLTAHALWNFLPSVYVVFVVVVWEGLLGGLVYVNTFAEILDRVDPLHREFSLGATSVSDSAGICLAGFLGMAFETALCRWQVDSGRPFCKML